MGKTTGQVCRDLNIKPYKLDYLVRNRLVPEPQKTGSGHRLFSDEDIKRIKEKLFEMSVRKEGGEKKETEVNSFMNQ